MRFPDGRTVRLVGWRHRPGGGEVEPGLTACLGVPPGRVQHRCWVIHQPHADIAPAVRVQVAPQQQRLWIRLDQ